MSACEHRPEIATDLMPAYSVYLSLGVFRNKLIRVTIKVQNYCVARMLTKLQSVRRMWVLTQLIAYV